MIQLAIGLDLRRHSFRVALIDKKGNVHFKMSEHIPDGTSVQDYYQLLKQGVEKLTIGLPEDNVVRGIGISAPNGNYFTGKISDSPSLPFKGTLDIVNAIKKQLGYKVVVVANDADAMALGELFYGGARYMRNFIEVIIRYGLGSGIIADRHVMQGKQGATGEFGHIKLHGKNRECGCGKTGCLETYVSHQGIMRNIVQLSGGNAEILAETGAANQDELDISEMLELLHLKNPKAVEAFRMSGYYLGEALANLQVLFDTEAIFLQGSTLKAGEKFLEPLYKAFDEKLSFPTTEAKDLIRLSQLPVDDASVLGASAIIWKELGY